MIKKTLFIFLVVLVAAVLSLGFYSNYIIEETASNRTFSEVAAIKKNRVGLLLGTSKYYKGGGLNLYFKYRIDAAEALYKAGKIDFILVSGDNGTVEYNEPINFKNELIKRGIPDYVIFLDYAGFRTLDSVVRAQAVFGLSEFTVISQKFHNHRAIYLAQAHGIEVIGFNAQDIPGGRSTKMQLREYFAKTKAYLDILFHVEPKFYGELVEIK